MKWLSLVAALALIGCERIRSTEEVAEDVADGTARETARSVATEVSAEQYREIDERLDRLEDESRQNLNSHVSMMNAVVATNRDDRDEVNRLRDHYNAHLRTEHGAR